MVQFIRLRGAIFGWAVFFAPARRCDVQHRIIRKIYKSN